MPLSPEVAAADALGLDRIRVQAYLDDSTDAKANRAKHLAAVEAHLAWVKAAHDALPPEPDSVLAFRRAFALAIADKYFTTSTSADGITDAAGDAARFGAALAAGLAKV